MIFGGFVDWSGPGDYAFVGDFGVQLCWLGCVWGFHCAFHGLRWGWMHCRDIGGLWFGCSFQVVWQCSGPVSLFDHLFGVFRARLI